MLSFALVLFGDSLEEEREFWVVTSHSVSYQKYAGIFMLLKIAKHCLCFLLLRAYLLWIIKNIKISSKRFLLQHVYKGE